MVPLTAGALRLVEVAGGPAVLPPDARFTGFPVALVVHIAGSAVFALGGVLQLVPRFRRRHLTWHRRAGRVVAFSGLLVAGSALWLTVGYEPRPGSGELLRVLRIVFGSGMVACLALGVAAIRRRDVAAHRAWMVRGYAIGLAAGTQVLTEPLGGGPARRHRGGVGPRQGRGLGGQPRHRGVGHPSLAGGRAPGRSRRVAVAGVAGGASMSAGSR